MKTVRISRLSLTNFKCHSSLSLDLLGKNATLRGDNATGKTSVYDALTWLLFGKDSRGQSEKNIDIKPLNADGTVRDRQAETGVEAVLTVDDTPITLKRTLREIWSTKRGSSEATYDGNTSDYAIDGVPMKKNEFDRRTAEIVSEDAFRSLTNVTYFAAEMDWRARRSALFDMAGVTSDRDIMALKPEFEMLSTALGRLTLDDYKKKLLAEKRALSGVRDTTPAKLSTLMEMESELRENDFEAARQGLAAGNIHKNEILSKLSALTQNAAIVGKRGEISDLRTALAKLDADNREHRAKQQAAQSYFSGIELEKRRLAAQVSSARERITHRNEYIERQKAEIASSRERWVAVNSETFVGGNCPTCGQSLPMEQLRTASEGFERRKRERLAEIERTANGCKEAIADTQAEISALQATIEETEAQIATLVNALTEAKETAAAPIADLPEYADAKTDIEAKIAAIEADIREVEKSSEGVKNALKVELATVNAALSDCNAILGREETLSNIRSKIEALRADAARSAKSLEDIEKMLFAIEEFTRFKVSFVEDSINGMFRLAKFRLFREQANGGIEDRCDVTVDGVPYASLNNGARINVGIDIIQALATHYGVAVPLFVDNAESVTQLQEIDTQVIRLLVDENAKELRCSYEN